MFVLIEEMALAGGAGPGPGPPPLAAILLAAFWPEGEGSGIADIGLIRLKPCEMACMSSMVSSCDEVRSISFLAPDLDSISSRSLLIFFKTS